MCGHGTIGTVTVAIEEGLVVPKVEGNFRSRRRLAKSISSMSGAGRSSTRFGASMLPATSMRRMSNSTFRARLRWQLLGHYRAASELVGLDGMPASEIVRLSPLVRRAVEEKLAPVHPEDNRIRWRKPCHVDREAAAGTGACSQRCFLRR